MNKKLLLLCACYLNSPLAAQNPDAFSFQGGRQSSPQQNTQDTHTRESNPKKNTPYGNEIPIFDPESENITMFGKNTNLRDSRLGGQFEAFLVMDEAKIEEVATYRRLMRDMLQTVDPLNNKLNRKGKVKKILQQLNKSAQYSADDKISESLRNSITFALLSMNTSERSEERIRRLQKEYKRLVKAMNREEQRPDFASAASPVGKNPDNKAVRRATNSLSTKSVEMKRQMAEKLAKIKKEDLAGGVTERLAKVQFQANLIQYFAQRRYEHVILGCRIYSIIFPDGRQSLKIKKGSDVDTFFKKSLGVNPTVSGLDSAANEAIGKAEKLAAAVSGHLRRKQVHSATQRMIEAFYIGEHLTPIHSFSQDKRDQMMSYIDNSKQLRDAINSKNWQAAELYVKKMKDQASDFRYIKAETAIAGYKNASDLELSNFEMAMVQKQSDKAQRHMADAIDYWPTNPRILKVRKAIIDKLREGQSNLESLENLRREFEAMEQIANYRTLTIEKAGTYIHAFKQAKARKDLPLEDRSTYTQHHTRAQELFDGLKGIQKAIERADAMSKESQHYAAWESIKYESEKNHPDKTRLNAKLLELSDRASKFKNLLDKADQLMTKKNYGSAISHYFQARSLYPKSKLAAAGIEAVFAEKNIAAAQ